MKAILEFNLPEEQSEYLLATRGNQYFCVIWDTLQSIRSSLKYGHQYKTADEALEAIQGMLYEAPLDDVS